MWHVWARARALSKQASQAHSTNRRGVECGASSAGRGTAGSACRAGWAARATPAGVRCSQAAQHCQQPADVVVSQGVAGDADAAPTQQLAAHPAGLPRRARVAALPGLAAATVAGADASRHAAGICGLHATRLLGALRSLCAGGLPEQQQHPAGEKRIGLCRALRLPLLLFLLAPVLVPAPTQTERQGA